MPLQTLRNAQGYSNGILFKLRFIYLVTKLLKNTSILLLQIGKNKLLNKR